MGDSLGVINVMAVCFQNMLAGICCLLLCCRCSLNLTAFGKPVRTAPKPTSCTARSCGTKASGGPVGGPACRLTPDAQPSSRKPDGARRGELLQGGSSGAAFGAVALGVVASFPFPGAGVVPFFPIPFALPGFWLKMKAI